jgi:hypothetical protein
VILYRDFTTFGKSNGQPLPTGTVHGAKCSHELCDPPPRSHLRDVLRMEARARSDPCPKTVSRLASYCVLTGMISAGGQYLVEVGTWQISRAAAAIFSEIVTSAEDSWDASRGAERRLPRGQFEAWR